MNATLAMSTKSKTVSSVEWQYFYLSKIADIVRLVGSNTKTCVENSQESKTERGSCCLGIISVVVGIMFYY